MRNLRSHLIVALGLVVVAGSASAQGSGWRVVPGVPALHLRFEDGSTRAPCPILGATPANAAVECWSAQVDRAVSRRTTPLSPEPSLACVGAWEIAAPGEEGCPQEAARCVRPEVGVFETLQSRLPIDSNIQAAWALTEDLAREYTAFQVLRNGRALNPHRPRIAGLALSQGLLVLYRAHALVSLGKHLEADGCAADHLRPYLDLAGRVTEEVGRSDVPEILETYPPPGSEWARRFHRVQLAVIGADPAVRLSGKWREDCEQASLFFSFVGRLDADVNVWCGYAYEQLGMFDAAMEHWHLARRSPNHPEAASYADEHLERARAEKPRGEHLADGGGE